MGGKGGGKGSASSSCSPQRYVNGSANGALPNDGQIDPCGLIAWSFFNDSYTASIVSSSGSPQPVAIDVRCCTTPCVPTNCRPQSEECSLSLMAVA